MTSAIGSHPSVGLPPHGAPSAEPAGRRPPGTSHHDSAPLERAPARYGADPLEGRPPKDADPRLWALLSRTERDFYFRNATFGALTYGPASGGTVPEAAGRRLGGRIDLTA